MRNLVETLRVDRHEYVYNGSIHIWPEAPNINLLVSLLGGVSLLGRVALLGVLLRLLDLPGVRRWRHGGDARGGEGVNLELTSFLDKGAAGATCGDEPVVVSGDAVVLANSSSKRSVDAAAAVQTATKEDAGEAAAISRELGV